MKVLFKYVFFIVALFVTGETGAQSVSKKRGKESVAFEGGIAIGKIKHHQKTGEWKYYHADGKLYLSNYFVQDHLNGWSMVYWENGTVRSRVRFVNDKREGVQETYYQNGKMSSKFIFLHDTLDGEQLTWFESGSLERKEFYLLQKPVYKWIYFENGHLYRVETYVNGEKSGVWRIYNDPKNSHDTLPWLIEEYANGKLNGVQIEYDAYGKKVKEIQYRNGVFEGYYKKWDARGELMLEENFQQGKKHGKCRYYNQGKLTREINYVNGRKQGLEEERDLQGILLRRTFYTNNEIDTVRTYFRNEKISTTRYYKRISGIAGFVTYSEYTEFDSSGVKLLSGKYRDEIHIDTWVTYYPNGKIKSETIYEKGKISLYKKWYMNGNQMLEIVCVGSEVTQDPKVWDKNHKPLKPGTKAYDEIVDGNKPGEIYNNASNYHKDRTQESNIIEEIIDVIGPGVTPDPNNEIINVTDQDEDPIFTYAEQNPTFIGPYDSLYKFIDKNLKYPSSLKDSGKQGKVFVQFVVEKDGSLTDIHVAKGVPGAPQFDEEAIRVVKLMPKWKPALVNGKPVRFSYIVPIKFTDESAGN